MSQQPRRIQFTPFSKIFLSLLAGAYLGYLIVFGGFMHASVVAPAATIIEHPVDTNSTSVIQYWSTANMQNAVDEDQLNSDAPVLTPTNSDSNPAKAGLQQGQRPLNSNVDYPLSTVGKVFFSNDAGQNMVCSGTAIVSANKNTVDTAGHCLYWQGGWVRNLVFCPLYENGNTPYGCWAARDLEIPSDWLNGKQNDFHHDMGMAIVTPNSQGNLTDMVGGAGWAYNQPVKQTFYAYGYPAAYPFDGQTLKSCESSAAKSWQHGGGQVVSIPCNMTGGSSGGPWFIKSGDNWYLDGHNDFTSSMQPGHMFSPYYDDTWYTLCGKAQNT